MKRIDFLLLGINLRQQRVFRLDCNVEFSLRQLFILIGIKLNIDAVDFLTLGLHLLHNGCVLRADLLIRRTECL